MGAFDSLLAWPDKIILIACLFIYHYSLQRSPIKIFIMGPIIIYSNKSIKERVEIRLCER